MTTTQLEAAAEPVYDLANPDPRRWRALMDIAISQSAARSAPPC